jgi:tetratricopeptide (TPR) repeat protein
MKNWWIGIGAVVALGAIMFMSDRKVDPPSGLDLIRDARQYAEANNKAAILAFEIFQKADSGGEVTDADKSKLSEAAKHFEAMQLYNPTQVQTFFGSGKCYMLLGEKQKAAERLEQAVLNGRIDTEKDKEAVKLTVFESAALLSEVTLDLAAEEIANFNSLSQANDTVGAEAAKKRSQIYYDKAFEFSNMAVEGVPKSPRYLVDRANVFLAMKKMDLAKKDIAKAMTLAPSDARVKLAAKMVGL